MSKIAPSASVVINLSYGATAGPHDGNTLIERALDRFCCEHRQPGRLRNLAIVLPAGNQFNAAGHVSASLAPGQDSTLRLLVRKEDPTETFVELWFDRQASTDGVEIEVCDPGGVSRLSSRSGWACFDGAAPQTSACSLALLDDPAASPQRTMALLSLRPTLATQEYQGTTADAGVWTIRVHNHTGIELKLDAWIQRDEPIRRPRFPARQAMFLSPVPRQQDKVGDSAANPVKRQGTGNSIANGEQTLVVGACSQQTNLPTSYSSAPASTLPRGRTRWPDLVAPGDVSEGMRGLRSAGTYSGSQTRASGTSMAAALVSRATLNLFASVATRPQMSKDEIVEALLQVDGVGGALRAGQPLPGQVQEPTPMTASRIGAGWLYARVVGAER